MYSVASEASHYARDVMREMDGLEMALVSSAALSFVCLVAAVTVLFLH